MQFVRHSFHDMPFKDVVAISHDHLSRIARFDVEPIDGDRLHSIGMEVRLMPALTAARMWCSPGRATRTKSHVADGNDNLVLVIPLNTEMLISRPGSADMVCSPREAFVWASDEPASFAYHQDCDVLNVSLSRAALGLRTGEPSDCLMSKFDLSAAADLWLLRNYTTMLVGEGLLSAAALHLAEGHILDLAALMLGPDRKRGEAVDGQSVRAARLAAIKAHVAANATRPLSAVAVARRHGVSPRYLRALFASEETSFTDFVLDHRLAKARDMLADQAFAACTIAAIAYEAGFNDLSYFNRAFRRRYGMTPTDARTLVQ
jgi:AraC-like DNA-binding protein